MTFGFEINTLEFDRYKTGIKTKEKTEVETTLRPAKIPKSCNASELIKNKHKKVIDVVTPHSNKGFVMSL